MSEKGNASLRDIEEAQKGLQQSIEQSRRLVARADQLIGGAREKIDAKAPLHKGDGRIG